MDKQKIKRCLDCRKWFLERYDNCVYCGSQNFKVEEVEKDDYNYTLQQDIIRRIIN